MAGALHIDQYSLSMSQYYWREGMNDRVSFELFVRSLPRPRGYLIAAGLGTALWHLRNYGFTKEEVDFLRSQRQFPTTPQAIYEAEDFRSTNPMGPKVIGQKDPPPLSENPLLYDPEFLSFLRDLDFTCDVWAIREGTPIGAQTPILRVTGPRIQCTLVESLLLSIINHQTMVASKASRIVSAAGDKQVWDFSLRRLHGPEASLGVARAAYIAGCAGTATVEAGRILKVPTTGTMAHAQVMAYGEEREQEVFEKTMREFPHTHALLVDTYNTTRGVMRAILASKKTGIPLNAIRIDSELQETAPIADYLLDGAAVGGMTELLAGVKVLASNDLDEYAIKSLGKTPIDGFGVGTMLGTSADAPHLGGVYKLVEQHDRSPRYVMKLTPHKQTDPGEHQVYRVYDDGDQALHDVLTPVLGPGPHYGMPLMVKVMQDGRILRPQPSLDDSRAYCAHELSRMPAEVRDLDAHASWSLVRSRELWELRASLGDEQAAQKLYQMDYEEE